MNVCINKNVELCQKAALDQDNEIYAMASDIALIKSKIPKMSAEEKNRAKATIEIIQKGKRRYTGGVFEPVSERKRIL